MGYAVGGLCGVTAQGLGGGSVGGGGRSDGLQKVADLTALWGALHAYQPLLSVSDDAVHCSIQPCDGRVIL